MSFAALGGSGGGGGGVSDHGGLTGLGDDDHTQYLRADGSRTATALTVTGTLASGGLLSVGGNIFQAGANRNLTMFNLSGSDADGGRSNPRYFAGVASGGSQFYTGSESFSHDGTGADQLTKYEAKINAGAAGLNPANLTTFLTVLSSLCATFAGEARSLLDHRIHVRNSSTQTLTGTSATTITLDTETHRDSGSFSFASSEVTIGYEGCADIFVNISPQIPVGSSRTVAEWWAEIDTGSGYTEIIGTRGVTRHFNSAAGFFNSSTCCAPVPVAVSDGDKIRLRGQNGVVSNNIDARAGMARLCIQRSRPET